MERLEKIEKLQALVDGEQPNYITVQCEGKTVGLVENDISLLVEGVNVKTCETFLKLRGSKLE